MAWATPQETPALAAEADAYAAATGQYASLTIDNDEASYRRDLQRALLSESPPDICLIESRDFSGIDPEMNLIPVTPPDGISQRSIAAFTVKQKVWAMPDEFSADMLFYNPKFFDEAAIGYPDRHWTWDIMEGITRALASLQLKNDAGAAVYPLELPANFDFWNILCTQAGHPALDRDTWHLADSDGKDSQMRGLDLINEFFHELAVTAPPEKNGDPPGRFFAQQRAALLIAPSELTASLPKFDYRLTLLPSDISRASLARVRGWAVTARCQEQPQALALAEYLSSQPVHAGWTSVREPADDASREAICYEALEQSLVPRIEPRTERLAELLDEQINLFARESDSSTTPEGLYGRIQDEYQAGYATGKKSGVNKDAVQPKAGGPQLRGF